MALFSTHSSQNSMEIHKEFDRKFEKLDRYLQERVSERPASREKVITKRVHTEESLEQLSSLE